jgi:hypothetical protein
VIVDTSAIIAILKEEDDAAVYAQAIASADMRKLSAASYLECGSVLDSQRDPIISISRGLDDLIQEAEIMGRAGDRAPGPPGPPGLRRFRQRQRPLGWFELRRLSVVRAGARPARAAALER